MTQEEMDQQSAELERLAQERMAGAEGLSLTDALSLVVADRPDLNAAWLALINRKVEAAKSIIAKGAERERADALGRLEKMRDRLRAEDPALSEAQAFAKAIESPAGAEIYGQYRDARE